MADADHFAVEFRDWGELRMGSPYNVYSVTFTGDWQPDLQASNLPDLAQASWANLYAVSDDRRYHGLILWDMEGNTSGFRVVIFDTQKRSIDVSDRYRGLPDNFQWINYHFKLSASIIIKPK
jgi:hypothetical protein